MPHTTNTGYFVPEKHIQLQKIANTPHWLRVHFGDEGEKKSAKFMITELEKILERLNGYGCGKHKQLEKQIINNIKVLKKVVGYCEAKAK